MQKLWNELLLALCFFTRLPVRASNTPLSTAVWAFPLAGAAVGAVGAAAFTAMQMAGAFPWISALAAIAAQLLITGALHEDGLADTFDGLGAGKDRAARLAIMDDSRIGTFGVLALMIVIGLRVESLVALANPWAVAAAMVAAGALSRSILSVLMIALPTAKSTGLAAMAGAPKGANVAVGIVIAVALAWLALGMGSLHAIAAATVIALLGYALARRALGGITGDVLGAVQQCAEAAVLVALSTL